MLIIINWYSSDNNDIDGENDDLMNVYTGVTPTRTTVSTIYSYRYDVIYYK